MILYLHLKSIYFHLVRKGLKHEELRLATPYWKKRLDNRTYDSIVVCNGYPEKDDAEKRLEFQWSGILRRVERHQEWNYKPREVYVIPLHRILNEREE